MLRIKCSNEQLDVIEDHLLTGAELGVLPDERHWMLAQVRKLHPEAKIKSANLDLENGEWELEI